MPKNKNTRPHPNGKPRGPKPPKPEEQPKPQPLVVATVQLFNQMPPQIMYVLSDGTHLASEGVVNPQQVDLIGTIIYRALTGEPAPLPPQEPAQDEEKHEPDEDTSTDVHVPENDDEDEVTIHVPEGVDAQDLKEALAAVLQQHLKGPAV